MQIADVMTKNPHWIGPETEVSDAIKMLYSLGVTSLPVVVASGHLVGMVSEGDILRMLSDNPSGQRPQPRLVREIMSVQVTTTRPDRTLADALDMFIKHKVKTLPVVENGRLLGMLSRSDVIRHAAYQRFLADMEF